MDSLGRTYLSPVLFGFALVHSDASRGLRVHSCSHGFTWTRICVAGFNRVRMGSLRRA